MSNQYDALIVGAGMVGSAIACGLAQAGMRVGIIDQMAPPAYQEGEAPHVRVSAISFASEQVLRYVGAWKYIEGMRVCPYRRLAVNELPAASGLASKLPDISSWARTEFSATDIDKTHLGHIIENDLIQLALHKAMQEYADIDLYCPANIAEWELGGGDKQLVLEDGTVLETHLVIGADGAMSRVRQESGIGQYREQYEQQAFVATVSYLGAQEDITWQCFTDHGPIAFLPLADSGGHHYASLVWYDTPEQVARLKAMTDDELLQFLQRSYPSDLPQLEVLVTRASFPLYKSHAKRYVSNGIALVGDAAHTINPLAGQGVNLGFMDAAVLIEVLAQARLEGTGLSDLVTLKQYESKRRLENQSMMSLMDAFYYGFSNNHLPLKVFRNIGLGLANRFGFAKHKVMQYAIGASGKLPKLAKPL